MSFWDSAKFLRPAISANEFLKLISNKDSLEKVSDAIRIFVISLFKHFMEPVSNLSIKSPATIFPNIPESQKRVYPNVLKSLHSHQSQTWLEIQEH